MKGDLSMRVMALGISVLILLSLVGCGNSSSGSDEGTPLLEFCNSKELNAWYEGLDDNPPVSLEYLVYGETVDTFELDNPELALRAAKAIATVRIGDRAKGYESPRNASDAPGIAYSFKMEDGERREFTFMMDCYQKGIAYYKVKSYGDLSDIDIEEAAAEEDSEVTALGETELAEVYSGDGLYRTKYPRSSSTRWFKQDGYSGGIGIYEDSMVDTPYVGVRIYSDIPLEPEEFLEKDYTEYKLKRSDSIGIIELYDMDGPYEYEIGGRKLAGMLYSERDNYNGKVSEELALAMKAVDEETGNEYLVQFDAGYDEYDKEGMDWAMSAVDAAVRGFEFCHVDDASKDNSSYVSVSAGDGSFIVSCPKDYKTRWVDTGLQIFIDRESDDPHIFVYTKNNADIDAGQWVEEVDWTHMLEDMGDGNAEFSKVRTYEIGGIKFKGMEFQYVANGPSTYAWESNVLCLATKIGDTILDYNVYYYTSEKDEIMEKLEDLVKNTELAK